MSVMAGAKAGWGALKSHWVFFTILILVLVLLAINYDQKNHTFSEWRDKVKTWPIIGGIFTAFAVVFVGLHMLGAGAGYAAHLLQVVS